MACQGRRTGSQVTILTLREATLDKYFLLLHSDLPRHPGDILVSDRPVEAKVVVVEDEAQRCAADAGTTRKGSLGQLG